MRIVNCFFEAILSCRNFLEKVEKRCLEKKRYSLGIVLIILVTGVTLFLCQQIILEAVIILLGMMLMTLPFIVGRKSSVRMLIKCCFVYNIFFSASLVSIIKALNSSLYEAPIFMMIYLLVWVFLSVLADSEISLLANEIISGIATTIFTIGTYLLSIISQKIPCLEAFFLLFLPIIGVTALSIIMVKIKDHWIKKYKSSMVESEENLK